MHTFPFVPLLFWQGWSSSSAALLSVVHLNIWTDSSPLSECDHVQHTQVFWRVLPGWNNPFLVCTTWVLSSEYILDIFLKNICVISLMLLLILFSYDYAKKIECQFYIYICISLLNFFLCYITEKLVKLAGAAMVLDRTPE